MAQHHKAAGCRFYPSLAGKLARSTATRTVDEIAQEIADLVKSRRDEV